MATKFLLKDDAFTRLIETHQQKVFNLAYSILRNVEEAKDVTQDVFLKSYAHLDDFRGEAEMSTWIYRITYNHALNVLKKHKRLNISVLAEEYEVTTEETEKNMGISLISPQEYASEFRIEQKEIRDLLWHALDSIPIPQRTAFLLHHYEGFSYQEIAHIMNKSFSSIESLIFRAKQNLKKKLMPYIEEIQKKSKKIQSNESK
ncbi:MAG: RNA polymerase sigma factor [Bacteroidales bacterium]|nr:RNA polymerase sigma factor [Bacteroidales bacterium]